MVVLGCICGGVIEGWWLIVVGIPFVGRWLYKKFHKGCKK